MLNDREWLAHLPLDEGRPVKGIRVRDFSPEVRVLADVVTALRSAIAAIVASGGGKPGRVEPYPGPITALDEVRFAQRKAAHEALVARVLPHKKG